MSDARIASALVDCLAGGLIARNSWTREDLLAYQVRQLACTLDRVVAASPYYRETIGPLIDASVPFASFPILTKGMLIRNYDRILTDPRLCLESLERHLAGEHVGDLVLGEYRVCATGGTSGERTIIAYDRECWAYSAANTARFMAMLGVTGQTRIVSIVAPSPLHISHRLFGELRAKRPDIPDINVSTPLPTVVEALNTYRPEAVVAYPSFLRLLAEEQIQGRLTIAPFRVCSTAEALTDAVRGLALRAWNVPVIDGFNTTEIGIRGMECVECAGIHLPEDLVVYEAVDSSNRPVAPGAPGTKLLITTLVNTVLPLIRFELNDMVTLDDTPCACGRPYQRMTGLVGRQEEVLRFGRVGGGVVELNVSRFRTPLLRIPGLRQFQFVPRSEALEVRISVREETDPAVVLAEATRTLRTTLESFGADVESLHVVAVDEITRAGSGAKERLVARMA